MICVDKDEVKKVIKGVEKAGEDQVWAPRPNVLCLHVGQPNIEKRPFCLHIFELYTSEAAYSDRLQSKKTTEALAPMLSEDAKKRQKTLIAGALSPSVMQKTKHIGGLYSALEGGFVLHPTPSLRCESEEDGAVLFEITLNPVDGKEQEVTEALKALCEKVKERKTLISAMILDGGYGADPRIVSQSANDDSWPTLFVGVAATSEKCAEVLRDDLLTKAASACATGSEARALRVYGHVSLALRVVLQNLEASVKFDCLECRTLGGYVIHPAVSVGDLDIEHDVADAAGTGARKKADENAPFYMKFNSDGTEPKTLIFRSGATSTTVTPPASSGGKGRGLLDISLLELLRKLGGRGAAKPEMEAELVFSQLGRLRGLLQDIEMFNQFNAARAKIPEGKEAPKADDGLLHRVNCVMANLSAFGYSLPQADSEVRIDGLAELIKLIEDSYSYIIAPARASLAADNTVDYIALMEYYHINDYVVASAAPLGGAPVAYRVCDIYFDTVRSVFGGKKLSFHLALELICNLGEQYAFVSYDEIVGDWEGTQHTKNLIYQKLDDKEVPVLGARGAHMLNLGLKPAYRAYRASCFFAHGSSKGAASQLSSAGRLVVDTARGLALGHHVSPGNDPVSLAIQATVKAYRNVQRAMAEGEKSAKLDERLKSAGLRLLQHVPSGLTHICWPAVVGFSLQIKRWGHVLVDGLSKIEPNSSAWDRLVLPKAKKELLLSLVEGAFDPTAPTLRDLVSNKGNGSLFLLHGVPGTGKTLTVESIAEKFGRPLYMLTFGELGTSVKELEATMSEVLGLCAGWGALVLLDEGDALVERREKGALLLNSMVGVLLKNLDAFEGLLFITTNRVASFDPAALSRVTLAIRYASLKVEGRMEVWKNVIERAGADPKDFDLRALAERGGSGRDINAVTRLAMSLAHHRKMKCVDQGILMEVLDIADDFKKDFAGGLRKHSDAGRVSDDEK